MTAPQAPAVPVSIADGSADIKARASTAQQRAAQAADAELMRLDLQIGRALLCRQSSLGWGNKVIARQASKPLLNSLSFVQQLTRELASERCGLPEEPQS
jgi:hypothetical protein